MKEHLIFYVDGINPNEQGLAFKVVDDKNDFQLPHGSEKLIGVDFERPSNSDEDRDLVILAAFLAGVRFSGKTHPIFDGVDLVIDFGNGSSPSVPVVLEIQSVSPPVSPS